MTVNLSRSASKFALSHFRLILELAEHDEFAVRDVRDDIEDFDMSFLRRAKHRGLIEKTGKVQERGRPPSLWRVRPEVEGYIKQHRTPQRCSE